MKGQNYYLLVTSHEYAIYSVFIYLHGIAFALQDISVGPELEFEGGFVWNYLKGLRK